VGEGNVVNEVEYEYNGWGKLWREYQEHSGAVDQDTTFVGYHYDDGATGGVAKYVRLEEVTYPNNRVFEREVQYGYGTTGAIDDIMSRLANIGDASGTYASYKYLGADRIVVEDYEDLDVKLDYTADDFAALDRFGRVHKQIWTDYGEDPDVVLDEYTYTYDRAGNRTSRDNELHPAFDEDYLYDGLNRLIDADRADAFDQSWTLDGLGNFRAFNDDGASQTRTANAANEITAITGGWITPGYDRAGNLISGPKPRSEATRVHYVYDAWNRLVKVRADDSGNPGDLLAEYEYDGTKRRVEKEVTDAGGGPAHVHYYYNDNWQLLEECSLDAEEELIASNQYVWSPRYIDSPVARFHDGNGDGDLLDPGDNTRYYTGDANYNVTATIDAATRDVVERYACTAYGEATVYDPNWSNPAAPTTDGPLYAGYFFDAESGFCQVRNRYYDAGLSTFLTRDPIRYGAGDSNLYRYVGGRPTVALDPSGNRIYPPVPPSGPTDWGSCDLLDRLAGTCCTVGQTSVFENRCAAKSLSQN
jgi:RHS repeat-associated protein